MASSPSRGLTIERSFAGAMAIVAPHGELDLVSATPLFTAVGEMLARRPLILALDLRAVDFIDGSTVGLLVALGQRCESASLRMLLVQGSPRIERVIAASGLEGHFDVVSGLDEIPGGEATGGLDLLA